ncbi:hypothetical protein F5X68DRAFT_258525 [Plectosphaerella plurivora]|uniref:N-acetyltransferase domain-containing protein n=1 Tax=Plectosphaerella plurivora TaxID=936078 RepID=A0A9P9AFH3_9PEZI|nr:hypothetical protein F5X68DRAFT_258525 [Plectosphaerella plurivora]
MAAVRDEKATAWLLGGQNTLQTIPVTGFLPVQAQPEEESTSNESTIRNFKRSPSVTPSTTTLEWGEPWSSDDWPAETQVEGDAPGQSDDIRHRIAPVNKMVRFEGRLFQTGQEEKDQDEVLETEEFLVNFIDGWKAKLPKFEIVPMNAKNLLQYAACSIDTESSRYMKKIVQPPSKRDLAEFKECSHALRTHRDIWTSRVRAIMHIKRQKANAAKNPRRFVTTTAPEGYVHTETKKPAVEDDECVLRPAIAEDMDGVAAIYNYEVFNSLRAWDTQKVPVSDFIGILNKCQEDCLPFIVAVRRPADDLELEVPDETTGEPEKVLGFGFLESLDGGFGRGKHVGNMSCRMTLYVHADHRKKHIGSAIIDRTLICMSRTHPGSAIDHQWESDEHHPYNDPELARMKRFLPNRIVIEGLFQGKKDEGWEWFDKMMASFRFNQVGHIDGAYSTRRGMRSECFDKFTWMYEAQMQPEPDYGDQTKDVSKELEKEKDEE